MIKYINRKVEEEFLGYIAEEDGDFEICFNNRYSMIEHKRVFWQFEVEGAFDMRKAEQQVLNTTLEIYNEASKGVEKVMKKVRFEIKIRYLPTYI